MIKPYRTRTERRAPLLLLALAVSVGVLAGCSDILEVERPGELTEEQASDPAAAASRVNSAIALAECAYSDLVASNASGNEDVWIGIDTNFQGFARYKSAPVLNDCDGGDDSYGWWVGFNSSRGFAETTYAMMEESTDALIGSDRQQLMALSALYAALSIDALAEVHCEIAFDGSALMTPVEALDRAEGWATTAIDLINQIGDFALPEQPAPASALMTAYGLRARIRWAAGDNAGAAQDAALVDDGFVAYSTRQGGSQQNLQNKVVSSHNIARRGSVSGPVDWWDMSQFDPSTSASWAFVNEYRGGEPWPNPIPFTGYLNLGILPDGRAIEDEPEYPITTTEYPSAVPDPRVRVQLGAVNMQLKYTDVGSPIPMVNWKEMRLIQAEIQGGQGAIDMVNEVRKADGLPLVTYADPGDAEEIRDMIIEERRRALWLEGRFWVTKIRNTDKLWFPRAEGQTSSEGAVYQYEGAVTQIMADIEFDLNTNFSRDDRGTLCPADQRPVVIEFRSGVDV